MEQVLSNRKQALRNKFSISCLSVIALVCTFVSSIAFFVLSFIIYLDNDIWVATLFAFGGVSIFVPDGLCITAIYLLFIYIFKHHHKGNSTRRLPVIFGLVALVAICDLILGNLFPIPHATFTKLLTPFIVVPAFSFATVGACKGFRNKKLLIIPIIAAIIATLFSTCADVFFVHPDRLDGHDLELLYYYVFTTLIHALGLIAFYVALLLLGLKNNLPSILKEKATPEQELKLLNEKLKLGIITNEEYQAQRADIISRL